MKKGTGQPGDLLIKLTVQDHKVFSRDAENVLSEAEIPFTKAVLGGQVQIESLKGKREITVAAGTQDGTKHVLKGEGMQRVTKQGAHGDHIVTLRIQVPTDLNQEQLQALKAFANLYEK